jgi:hypothetical protein
MLHNTNREASVSPILLYDTTFVFHVNRPLVNLHVLLGHIESRMARLGEFSPNG